MYDILYSVNFFNIYITFKFINILAWEYEIKNVRRVHIGLLIVAYNV